MGVAAVLAPILVALVSRRRKKLLFDVGCEAWLIERKGEKEAKSPEDTSEAAALVLFVIDLRNPSWGIFSWLGGLDISPEQYERRISFSFGENPRILKAEVVEEHPQGIGAEAIVHHVPPDTLTLKPMLLNQGDSVRLRVMVENPKIEANLSLWRALFFGRFGLYAVKAEGRIRGVTEIQRKRSSGQLINIGFSLLLLGLLPLAIVYVLGLFVWLFTGSTDLMVAAPLPWFAAPVPGTFLDPLTLITGTQTALCFTGQFIFLLGKLRYLRARRLSKQYSPTWSSPMTIS